MRNIFPSVSLAKLKHVQDHLAQSILNFREWFSSSEGTLNQTFVFEPLAEGLVLRMHSTRFVRVAVCHAGVEEVNVVRVATVASTLLVDCIQALGSLFVQIEIVVWLELDDQHLHVAALVINLASESFGVSIRSAEVGEGPLWRIVRRNIHELIHYSRFRDVFEQEANV